MGTASGSSGASPPIVMALNLKDPAEVQPVVDCMCHIILSAYMRSDKNEANEATKAKSDQSEYKEEEEEEGGDDG